MRSRSLFPALALALLACPADDGDDADADEIGSETETETGTSETSSTSSSTDETETSETESETETDTSAALDPDPGADLYVLIDEQFELDAGASTGAVLYQWDFADGTPAAEPSRNPIASHSYAAPGRYYPVLTVWDEMGNSLSESVTVTATYELIHEPRQTGTIVALDPLGLDGVAVVAPDSDELTIVLRSFTGERPSFAVLDRFSTCDHPRSVGIVDAQRLALTCQDSEQVQLFDLDGLLTTIDLPYGSRPFAALAVGDLLVVSLAGTGELARFDLAGDPPIALPSIFAIDDARGLALWPDGRVVVTRWRSPDEQGELVLVDPITGERTALSLAFDPTPPSDTEIGGVPSYLDQVLVSPTAREAAVPSIQAAFNQGMFVSGEPLTFETTVRAVVSWIELVPSGELLAGSEQFDRRKQFDNRGFASAGVLSSHGDFLFVADRGSRGVERYDVLTGTQAGSLLDVGYAPSGLALAADDRHLYVDAFLSRELRVYDVSDFSQLPQPIAILDSQSAEPLAPEVFRGKQLFNDSFDPRLAKHGYIACAHCHLDGEADLRTWDFTDRGEGLRNTISLLGRGGTEQGPIHWSANFDEVQDFEHDIRGPFGGFGLLDDADWNSGTVNTTLGDPKAGLSADLDALAAYVESLDTYPRSPYRLADGSLSPAAEAGKLLFESPALGCLQCHAGPNLTDSAWVSPAVPLLHDVGTIGPGSGMRLGEPLTGLDTPTLHELWNSPPYLHDGSAATLLDVLLDANPADLHGSTSGLSPEQIVQLVIYLLSLEGPE